jgi:tRNA uridine 5-carbamoylmethylation protein Kti12
VASKNVESATKLEELSRLESKMVNELKKAKDEAKDAEVKVAVRCFKMLIK